MVFENSITLYGDFNVPTNAGTLDVGRNVTKQFVLDPRATASRPGIGTSGASLEVTVGQMYYDTGLQAVGVCVDTSIADAVAGTPSARWRYYKADSLINILAGNGTSVSESTTGGLKTFTTSAFIDADDSTVADLDETMAWAGTDTKKSIGLKNRNIAGTYCKVTVNKFGIVTAGNVTITKDDISDWENQIAIVLNTKLAAGNGISISGTGSAAKTISTNIDTSTMAFNGNLLSLKSFTSYAQGFYKITVDLYGRVTSAAAVTATDLPAHASRHQSGGSDELLLNLLRCAGDVNMQGFKLSNLGAPVSANDAATRQFVLDSMVGIQNKGEVRVATVEALPACTATTQTLTANANGVLPAIDGVTLIANDKLLVKSQVSKAQNGLYYVSDIGSASTPWVLSRIASADTWGEYFKAYCFVLEGTENAYSSWLSDAANSGVLGTNDIPWTIFSRAGEYAAGLSLRLSGGVFNVNVDYEYEVLPGASESIYGTIEHKYYDSQSYLRVRLQDDNGPRNPVQAGPQGVCLVYDSSDFNVHTDPGDAAASEFGKLRQRVKTFTGTWTGNDIAVEAVFDIYAWAQTAFSKTDVQRGLLSLVHVQTYALENGLMKQVYMDVEWDEEQSTITNGMLRISRKAALPAGAVRYVKATIRYDGD